MNRQTLDAETEAWIAERRAYHRGEADNGADDSFEPRHRRNRADVLGPLSRVKEGDDVLIDNDTYRVICPARDEGWFYAAQPAPWGWIDAPMDGSAITDRAPADANEEALPIFLEGEEPAPEPEP